MKYLKVSTKKMGLYIGLNRPEVRNAFNPDLMSELKSVFSHLNQYPNLRYCVLYGEGKSFCAGGDLEWMRSMASYSREQNLEDANQLFELFSIIDACAIPVVGIAHGAVFGGGLGLLANCDLVFTESKTQFCFSEVRLGIAPAVISEFILKKCSYGAVAPYLISGKVFGSEQALRMGLAHDSFLIEKRESLDAEIDALFAAASPGAVRATKKLIRSRSSMTADLYRESAVELIAELRVSAEGQEGLSAFLQSRSPGWKPS